MPENDLRQRIVVALSTEIMTSHALADKLDVMRNDVVKLLSKKSGWPEGFELYQWRDNVGQRHYQLVPPPDVAPAPEPRTFRVLRAKAPTPYLRVFIPDDVLDVHGKPAEHIELYPLSDVHWGHKQCDVGAFTRDVKEIARRPNRFAIWNGDNMDNTLGHSAGGAAWAEQKTDPKIQRRQLTQVFRPIAHKTLAATPGNHEDRSYLAALMNPLEEIAEDLNVPYFDGPYNMEIVWRDCRWTFHIMHGTGNSGTAGGKLNSAGRPRTFNDVRHFFISGHVHHQTTGKNIRVVRRRVFNHSTQTIERFWKEDVKEYIVICPAYLDYEDTYAYRWGLSPGSRNTVTIQLFANGDYHVVASKRSTRKDDLDEVISEDRINDRQEKSGSSEEPE